MSPAGPLDLGNISPLPYGTNISKNLNFSLFSYRTGIFRTISRSAKEFKYEVVRNDPGLKEVARAIRKALRLLLYKELVGVM